MHCAHRAGTVSPAKQGLCEHATSGEQDDENDAEELAFERASLRLLGAEQPEQPSQQQPPGGADSSYRHGTPSPPLARSPSPSGLEGGGTVASDRLGAVTAVVVAAQALKSR
jgi:hypothetical protein